MAPGLDFVALTDHNTGTGWPEEDRLRGDYPGRLVLRGEEVTTYNGHTNNIASGVEPDYRTGPLYERQGDGALRLVRAAQPVSSVFDTVNRAGGITQINHPTLFPSPPFPSNLCRGCQWTHPDGATDYSKVDSIEVATGPQRVSAAPNPFVATAIEFWDDKLRRGHHIAAVGGQRRPSRVRGHRAHRRARRPADDDGAGLRPVRAERAPGRRGRPHLRQGRGPGRARPGPDRTHPRHDAGPTRSSATPSTRPPRSTSAPRSAAPAARRSFR